MEKRKGPYKQSEGKITHEWIKTTSPYGEPCRQCRKCLMYWFDQFYEPRPTGMSCFEPINADRAEVDLK